MGIIMKIDFYVSNSGRSYIEILLNKLNIEDRASIVAVFTEIQHYGFSAVGCQFRHIEGKLWEIKIRAKNGSYRFFYAMRTKDNMVLLHAYKKRSLKAPKKEMKIARKRLKEVLK